MSMIPAEVRAVFNVAEGENPADFTVVAGSYDYNEFDELMEYPDYISGPMTWEEAMAELPRHYSHQFSYIERGDARMGPVEAKRFLA